MRARPEEYRRLPLRAHSLLADVPLHDVWMVDLPGGGPGRSVTDVHALLTAAQTGSAAVKALAGFRRLLGQLFDWDREPRGASEESFLHRLSAEDRTRSLVPPGTLQGPFRVLFASREESISEIHNSTVHAFSVFALVEIASGYRLYWAIYVRPVGSITAWYMRLIDPFRRFIIYPAMLAQMRAAWVRGVPEGAPRKAAVEIGR